jgi:hypothetical protein
MSDSFERTRLTLSVVQALELAAARRGMKPLGTFDLLVALQDATPSIEWSWIELEASAIRLEDAPRFADPQDQGGAWKNVPLTAAAEQALERAAMVAAAYDLIPLPPGAMAIGLLADADAGATQALLRSGQMSHSELLSLVQEITLGSTLEALEALLEPDAHESTSKRGLGKPSLEIARLARDISKRQSSAYLLITSAAWVEADIRRDPDRWKDAATHAGISLDAYRANLLHSIEHPRESIAIIDTLLDQELVGARLSQNVADSWARASQMAIQLAASEDSDPAPLIAPLLLALPEADATTGLSALAGSQMSAHLLARTGAGESQSPGGRNQGDVVEEIQQERKPAKGAVIAGTLIGSAILALVGGATWGFALAVGNIARWAVLRDKRNTNNRFIAALSVLALLAAIALAVTAPISLAGEGTAVSHLQAAKKAIDDNDLPTAMRELGGAGLYENRSPVISILGACVDWELGYRDFAVVEAQTAILLGYNLSGPSGYRGRDCFIDTPSLHGLSYTEGIADFPHILYPVPSAKDSLGQEYLQFATDDAKDPHEREVALACLSHKYHLDATAGQLLTAGVDGFLAFHPGQALTSTILRDCLAQKSLRHIMVYRHDPTLNADIYGPRDQFERIPSPSKPYAPVNACWAQFPAEQKGCKSG